MKTKYKVYEIGNEDDKYEDPWRIWIAVPEGFNVENLGIAYHLTCQYRKDMNEKTPGVDFVFHNGVAS